MLAALMLAQAAAVRASMADWLLLQRFLVLSPSVSRMITLSRSGCGSCAWLNGWLLVKACQPQTSPMVMLVYPTGIADGVILSTLLFRSAHTLLSGMASVSVPQGAAG